MTPLAAFAGLALLAAGWTLRTLLGARNSQPTCLAAGCGAALDSNAAAYDLTGGQHTPVAWYCPSCGTVTRLHIPHRKP